MKGILETQKKPPKIMESFSLVVKVNDYFTTHNISKRSGRDSNPRPHA